MSTFDEYSGDYDSALERGLAVSGEGKDFFAAGRVDFLKSCLAGLRARPADVMDFGCGTGSASPFLLGIPGAKSLTGIDVSEKSLEAARRAWGPAGVRFLPREAEPPVVDLVYCNGAFHHITPPERSAALAYIYGALRPHGLFSLWENNPWNPGTRYVMSRIPFDRDAVPLSAVEARRRAREAGFQVLRTDFLFIFPHFLRRLRPLEKPLSSLPLGAQYQVLCRRP
jgi:SAM-dependent methyltransferase